MAFSGERHIEHPRQAHTNGPPGFPCAERGDGSVGIGLDFFTAEGAAHAKALDGHLIAGDAEDARRDLLGFAWMLRGGVEGDSARLVEPRDGALRFDLEVLLAADAQ